MDLTPVPELDQPHADAKSHPARDQSGIALFMVMAAMAILTILVTEFTYVAQVNQRMAYDGLDQLQAHYLAKSGLKLSLLRLKAYQQIKAVAKTVGGGAGIPKSILEKIWSFPFFYPFPTNIPGMSPGDKDRIAAFQKESGLTGTFSAVVESESSKLNLNSMLVQFAPTPGPSTSPAPAGNPPGNGFAPPVSQPSPNPNPGATSQTPAAFDPAAARASLKDYFAQILDQKFQADPDFAADYRDFRLDDFMENLYAWADRTYEARSTGGREVIKPKRAPFYSIQELHMIYPMDDRLYELLSPNLTVSTTPGININSIQENALHALLPGMVKEEIKEFFKFRDDPEADNYFKGDEDFFKYIGEKVAAYQRPDDIKKVKDDFIKRNIRIITDEQNFKISVQATVGNTTRLLQAWVLLKDPTGAPTTPNPKPTAGSTPPPQGQAPPLSGAGGDGPQRPDSGLKITFMTIL